MLLSKRQLLAHKFASTDETRPMLNGILIEPSGRVLASDGHAAVIVPANEANAADFPHKDGAPWGYQNAGAALAYVRAAVVAQLARDGHAIASGFNPDGTEDERENAV